MRFVQVFYRASPSQGARQQKNGYTGKKPTVNGLNPFKSRKNSYFISRRPQLVIVPLLCPLGSVEPCKLVPRQGSRCHCHLETPTAPPSRSLCPNLAYSGGGTRPVQGTRGPKNKFTKRSMAYGIWYFVHARIREASMSLTFSYYSCCFFVCRRLKRLVSPPLQFTCLHRKNTWESNKLRHLQHPDSWYRARAVPGRSQICLGQVAL